jgi:hypothetical protein
MPLGLFIGIIFILLWSVFVAYLVANDWKDKR